MGKIKKMNIFNTRAYIRCMGKTQRLAALFLIVIGFILCELAYAETFNDMCEKIKDQLAKTKCNELIEFSQAIDRFIKIKKDAERLKVSIDAGYTGDISNTDKRQLINLDSSIDKEI